MSSWVGTEIPVNYMKEGTNPTVKEREEYPEWVWRMGESETLSGLNEKIEKDGFDSLDLFSQRKWVKLSNTRDIKEANIETLA